MAFSKGKKINLQIGESDKFVRFYFYQQVIINKYTFL